MLPDSDKVTFYKGLMDKLINLLKEEKPTKNYRMEPTTIRNVCKVIKKAKIKCLDQMVYQPLIINILKVDYYNCSKKKNQFYFTEWKYTR